MDHKVRALVQQCDTQWIAQCKEVVWRAMAHLLGQGAGPCWIYMPLTCRQGVMHGSFVGRLHRLPSVLKCTSCRAKDGQRRQCPSYPCSGGYQLWGWGGLGGWSVGFDGMNTNHHGSLHAASTSIACHFQQVEHAIALRRWYNSSYLQQCACHSRPCQPM